MRWKVVKKMVHTHTHRERKKERDIERGCQSQRILMNLYVKTTKTDMPEHFKKPGNG